MPTSVQTRLREATRGKDKLNILTFVTHERYEPNLCKTGHNFWSWQGGGIRQWNTKYAPIPENYHILDGTLAQRQLPLWLDLDLIIAQNPFEHLSIAKSIAHQLDIPVISIWHTLPAPGFDFNQLRANAEMLSDCLHVFISDFNKKEWQFAANSGTVIRHGVNTDFWSPSGERKPHALSVVNDWINRDWCCGFSQWKAGIMDQEVPHKVMGDTPGLSKPSESLEELRGAFQEAQVFVNTSTVSPIPMSLLEAMSCGCGVVSANTCMIPEIISHGFNGYLVEPDDVEGLTRYTKELLEDKAKAKRFGHNARNTITERFGISRFVTEWNKTIEHVLCNQKAGE